MKNKGYWSPFHLCIAKKASVGNYIITMKMWGIKVKILCHYIFSILVVVFNFLYSMIYVTAKGNTPVLKTLFSIIWEKLSTRTFHWHLWEWVDPLVSSHFLCILVKVKMSSISNSHKVFPFLPQTQKDLSIRYFLPSSHPQMSYLFFEWVDYFLLSNPNLSESAVTHEVNPCPSAQNKAFQSPLLSAQVKVVFLVAIVIITMKLGTKVTVTAVLILCVNKETKDSQLDRCNKLCEF